MYGGQQKQKSTRDGRGARRILLLACEGLELGLGGEGAPKTCYLPYVLLSEHPSHHGLEGQFLCGYSTLLSDEMIAISLFISLTTTSQTRGPTIVFFCV
jgi:hypothetical protein